MGNVRSLEAVTDCDMISLTHEKVQFVYMDTSVIGGCSDIAWKNAKNPNRLEKTQ
jgi:hypothetical protein